MFIYARNITILHCNYIDVRSKAIDLSQLCIKAGLACWTIYADIVFLSFDGSPIDVALQALMAALEKRILIL